MGRRFGLQNLQSRRMDKGRNRSSISEIKSEIPPYKPPKAGSNRVRSPHANSPLNRPPQVIHDITALGPQYRKMPLEGDSIPYIKLWLCII